MALASFYKQLIAPTFEINGINPLIHIIYEKRIQRYKHLDNIQMHPFTEKKQMKVCVIIDFL